MSAFARSFEVKVFLEGLEVKFNSVRVHESVGANMTRCDITLAPSKSLKKIQVRTLVHVAFRRVSPDGRRGELYCMFEGEVGQYGFVDSGSSARSFQIIAFGFGNYWDFAKLYYVDRSLSGVNFTGQSSGFEGFLNGSLGSDSQLGGTDPNVSIEQRIERISSVESYPNLTQSKNWVNSDIHAAFLNRPFAEGLQTLFELMFKEREPTGDAAQDEARKYQFAYDAENRLKLIERIIVSVANTGDFINNESLSYYISQINAASGGFINFSEVLRLTLHAVFHDYVCLAAPVRRGRSREVTTQDRRSNVGSLIGADPLDEEAADRFRSAESAVDQSVVPGTYIFKPNAFFTPPPTCNVFFPQGYGTRSFMRSFFDEPTRLYFSGSPPTFSTSPGALSADIVYDVPYIAPGSEFRDKGLLVGRDSTGAPIYEQLENVLKTKNFLNFEYHYLSEREQDVGVLPQAAGHLPMGWLLEDATKDGAKERRDQRYQNIADFNYWMRFYSVGRSQSVTAEFQPWVVSGFPALMLDDSDAEFHIIGYVQSVSHYITSNGHAQTDVSMSLCREVTEERPVFEGGSGLPHWFEESVFSDEQIGSVFYPEVLGEGVGSVADYADEGEGEDPIEAGADGLLQRYRRAVASGVGSAVQAEMDEVTERPLLTMDEIMGFLGAEKSNDGWYHNAEDGSEAPFLDKRRQPILDHINEVAKGALIG